MKKILQELYHGKVFGQERNTYETDEAKEKIRSERRYFKFVLSEKDFARFEALEALHKEHSIRKREEIYANAFRLGVMLMCAVFMNDGEEDLK